MSMQIRGAEAVEETPPTVAVTVAQHEKLCVAQGSELLEHRLEAVPPRVVAVVVVE